MNTLHLLTVGTLVLVVAAGDDGAKVKAELKKLQGAWTLERLEYGGRDITETYKVEIAIKDGTLAVAGNKVAEEYGKFALTVDPRTTPRCVDFAVIVGGQKGAKLEGIYQLKDDKLTFCIQAFGKDRPDKFKSPEGSSIAVVVFKRKSE